jgi:hypothetical protein
LLIEGLIGEFGLIIGSRSVGEILIMPDHLYSLFVVGYLLELDKAADAFG